MAVLRRALTLLLVIAVSVQASSGTVLACKHQRGHWVAVQATAAAAQTLVQEKVAAQRNSTEKQLAPCAGCGSVCCQAASPMSPAEQGELPPESPASAVLHTSFISWTESVPRKPPRS
jgi:hypothetical protein